ncbi:MAG: hypothetical protein ACXV5Q_00445 [Frankiaceae bacterium]
MSEVDGPYAAKRRTSLEERRRHTATNQEDRYVSVTMTQVSPPGTRIPERVSPPAGTVSRVNVGIVGGSLNEQP